MHRKNTGSIVYKLSTDGGDIWGTETELAASKDDHRITMGGTSVGNDGGRVQPAWFNDDLNDLKTNKDNSIEIAAFVPSVILGTGFGYSSPFVSISYVA